MGLVAKQNSDFWFFWDTLLYIHYSEFHVLQQSSGEIQLEKQELVQKSSEPNEKLHKKDNFKATSGTHWYIFETTWRPLGDMLNLELWITEGELWDNLEGIFWQFWANSGTTWWLLTKKFLVTIGGAYLSSVVSIWPYFHSSHYLKIVFSYKEVWP